jgi:hypothetical protein
MLQDVYQRCDVFLFPDEDGYLFVAANEAGRDEFGRLFDAAVDSSHRSAAGEIRYGLLRSGPCHGRSCGRSPAGWSTFRSAARARCV